MSRRLNVAKWIERAFGPLGSRLGWERNYLLGVLNGWFVFTGDGFMNASIVLTSFATILQAPNTVIGLLPAIQNGGWLLPQLLVASQIHHLSQKIVIYRAASTVRTLALIWIVVTSALLAAHPVWLLIAFIIGLTVNAFASGVSGLPFMETVAKVIPPAARAQFFGTRNLIGGLFGLGAGLVVRLLLGSSIDFPFNYTLIFLCGAIVYSIGYAIYGLIDEPIEPPLPRTRFRDELRHIPNTIARDRAFEAYLSVRVVAAIAALAEPFFTVYALRVIDVSKESVAGFLIVLGITGPLSNIVWTRLMQRHHTRYIFQIALGLACSAPIVALLMPKGAGLWYALVFILSSSASAGLVLASNNHLLALAPPQARGRYIGTVNTFVGIATFAPVLGGRIADTHGYQFVFALGIGLYAIAWLLASRLRSP